MKIIRTTDGRRINLEQLALWRVENGSVWGMLSGHPQLVQVVTEIDPKHAEWIGRLMDDAAVSKEQSKLLDVRQLISDFEAGAYVSEDMNGGQP